MLSSRAELMRPRRTTDSESDPSPSSEHDGERSTRTSTSMSECTSPRRRKRKRDREHSQLRREMAAGKPLAKTVDKLIKTAKTTLTVHHRIFLGYSSALIARLRRGDADVKTLEESFAAELRELRDEKEAARVRDESHRRAAERNVIQRGKRCFHAPKTILHLLRVARELLPHGKGRRIH